MPRKIFPLISCARLTSYYLLAQISIRFAKRTPVLVSPKRNRHLALAAVKTTFSSIPARRNRGSHPSLVALGGTTRTHAYSSALTSPPNDHTHTILHVPIVIVSHVDAVPDYHQTRLHRRTAPPRIQMPPPCSGGGGHLRLRRVGDFPGDTDKDT
jgi:hypothetical protein